MSSEEYKNPEFDDCWASLAEIIGKEEPNFAASSDNSNQTGIGEAYKDIEESMKNISILEKKFSSTREKNNLTMGSIDTIEAQTPAIKEDVSNLRISIADLKESRSVRAKWIKKMSGKINSTVKQLQGGNLKYMTDIQSVIDNVGLEISFNETTDKESKIQIIVYFHGLNNQMCTCEIAVEENFFQQQKYEVIRSSPELKKRRVASLEKRLNQTNDLCGFFVKIRKEFLLLSEENCAFEKQ